MFEVSVTLQAGQEWTSDVLHFQPGDNVCLKCESGVRFYAGLFEANKYDQLRRGRSVFPFTRGTDRRYFERSLTVPPIPTGYRVVLRIGVFAPGGEIGVAIWKASEIEVASSLAHSVLEVDTSVEKARAKRGRSVFAIALLAVVVSATWLSYYDFVVIGINDRTDFFNALSAEASAVLAVAAVVGGLYGIWKVLVFPKVN